MKQKLYDQYIQQQRRNLSLQEAQRTRPMNRSLRNNAVERKSSKQMIVENKTTTRLALQPGLTLPVNKNIYQALKGTFLRFPLNM